MYIIVFLKYNIFFLYFQEKYFKLFCKKVKRYIMYREVIIKKKIVLFQILYSCIFKFEFDSICIFWGVISYKYINCI